MKSPEDKEKWIINEKGSEIWVQKTIAGILENLEYTGCTINFKTSFIVFGNQN